MGVRLTILIAVVPAIAMLMFIYHRDKREKEPVKFLVLLCVLGAASTIPAAIIELLGETVVQELELSTNSALFFECFFIVGVTEELGKFLISTCVTWKNKSFKHSYDAIVYTACVSLGFALLENILYVFTGGISTGIFRAFTAVPLHCGVGVIMGAFYGKARESAYKEDGGAVIGFMALAYIVPVIIHGAYDYAAFGTAYNISEGAMFFVILALVYVAAIWLIIYCSNHDHRIDGLPETADIGYYRKEYKRFHQGYGYGYNNVNNMGNYNPYGNNENVSGNPYAYSGNNYNGGVNNNYNSNYNYINYANPGNINNQNSYSNAGYNNQYNNNYNNSYSNNSINNNNADNSNYNNGYNQQINNNNYNSYNQQANNNYYSSYNQQANNNYYNNYNQQTNTNNYSGYNQQTGNNNYNDSYNTYNNEYQNNDNWGNTD
jgi:RsiW-degrading membrane proteinase PrsW (M82 family)